MLAAAEPDLEPDIVERTFEDFSQERGRGRRNVERQPRQQACDQVGLFQDTNRSQGDVLEIANWGPDEVQPWREIDLSHEPECSIGNNLRFKLRVSCCRFQSSKFSKFKI